MIKIKKNSPPLSFLTYSQTPGATFNDMPSQVKSDLREALLIEQGYICAYCTVKLENNALKTKIEHYISRNTNIDLQLDYLNLFIVCLGNEGYKKEFQTCDSKKGSIDLRIDPKIDSHIATIFYKSDGQIHSRNLTYEDDLNKTLNLNHGKYLAYNRKVALDNFKIKFLGERNGLRTKSQLQNFYNKYLNDKNERGYYEPYVGIILDCLKKKGKF
ncbi:MAG: retron system putative HNH endonuclease [Fusobacteriaceae bacterium]